MPIIDVPRKPSCKDPMYMWTCFLYLGVYPRFLWNQSEKLCFEPSQIATVTNCDKAGIPAVAICDLSQCFCPFRWVFSVVYLFVCISVIMPIIDVPSKPSWKEPMSMWTCFLCLGVCPPLLWNLSKKLCFEPSQIATVTNCGNSGIPAIALCDLSQSVIKTVTALTESNNTENAFSVLGRVPWFTFEMNMKSGIF